MLEGLFFPSKPPFPANYTAREVCDGCRVEYHGGTEALVHNQTDRSSVHLIELVVSSHLSGKCQGVLSLVMRAVYPLLVSKSKPVQKVGVPCFVL